MKCATLLPISGIVIYMSIQNPKHLAIEILSRRDNSEKEMRKKLSRKGVSDEEIDETIVWLREKELLDDREFARKKAESIMRTKAVGPHYISNKLREVGITEEIREKTIDSLGSEQLWQNQAKKALEQWKRAHPKYEDDKVRHTRFLVSRGFDIFDL
jgi:regulatory protein